MTDGDITMQTKKHVLIVEGHEGWRNVLHKAIPAEDFDVQLAQNYDEAMTALNAQTFDLAIVDPVLEGADSLAPLSAHPITEGTDGLRLLNRLISRFPHTRLIILSGSVGREMLRNSLELPPELPVIQRQEWDERRFLQTMSHLLAEDFVERWGPPEPQIDMPDGGALRSPIHERYEGLTGPLTPTGFTAPLPTGLVPPPVGSRRDRPRVLVVDHDPEWQHRLAELLESKLFFWRVAADLEQAIERLRLESFHVVITDLKLERSDIPLQDSGGWHLLDHLMRHSPRPKFFVSSGEATRGEVARLFLTYPVKGFIDKERYDEDELVSALRVQLSGPSLRIQTLGDFRIWRDNVPVTHFGDDHAERLIKILITARGQDLSVESLIQTLWPGESPRTHSALLGATVNHARRALEPDLPRPNDSHFIIRNGSQYSFNHLANVEIDSEQLRRVVSEGRQHEHERESAEALHDYETARQIYQGDYMPSERSELWAVQERTMLQALYADALNRTADLYSGGGRLDDAIEAANLALQVDAYNESTYRRLMRYHACKGERHAAISAYRTLEKLFSEFMDQTPSSLAQDLYQRIEGNQPVECVEALPGDTKPLQPIQEDAA